MRILIDITHPAYAHFFRAVMPALEADGHEITVTSREKDLTVPLLDAWGLDHRCLSTAGRSPIGLLFEVAARVRRLCRVIRKTKPDLVLARDGAFACLAGKLTGVRAISFDDTDDAPIQQALSFPFAWRVYTDRRHRRSAGRRHRHFDGVSCLAYLGPRVFRADPEVVRRHGVTPDEALIVVRLVSWTANHDIGHRGFDRRHLSTLLHRLGTAGRLVMSDESGSSGDAATTLQSVPPTDMHHVLAHSRLYVGESATMAAEAAVLGVPAIHVSTRRVWYTDMLEEEFGLVRNVSSGADCLEAAEEILADPRSRERYRERRDAYLRTTDDLVGVVLAAVAEAEGGADVGAHLRHAASPTTGNPR